MAEKNGNGNAALFLRWGAILAVGLPVAGLIYNAGEQSKKLEHTTLEVLESKSIVPLVSELKDNQGIAATKIADNSQSLTKVFITENLMREEIQHLAENKVDKDDFYRLKTEMGVTLHNLSQRILYLERQIRIDIPLHEELHAPHE